MVEMIRLAFALTFAAGLLAGCAGAPPEGDAEPAPRQRAPAAEPEKKEYGGVVESVREVELEGERSAVAPMAGAVVGGAAGSSVGRGRGAAAGGVVGTVVGAVVGESVAQGEPRKALEITVRLDEGRVIAVTQPPGKETFKTGDRVRVVSDGRIARVVR
jgi:outer membrane lipoprotein SlyB